MLHAEGEEGLKPEEGRSREGEDGKGSKVSVDSQGKPEEKCVANTDKVDREIKNIPDNAVNIDITT